MTTRSETLNRLVIPSPCRESWQAMSGDGHSRFCAQCQKHVYDLAAMEAREIEALVEATQGRFCARITRDRFGRMVTREPDVPPFHLPAVLSVRRASPVVAAVVTAVVGLSGAGWAAAPVSAPIAAPVAGDSAAPDPAYPAEPGGAVLDGCVVDDHGFALPGTTIVVIHPEEGWRFVAVTDAQGRFRLRDLPRGVYDVEIELEGFDFKNVTGLKLGRRGRQITFTGTLSETNRITVTMGETWRPIALPLDEVLRQSYVVVAATVGSSVTLQGPGVGGGGRKARTELRITSVLKGKPRGRTIQLDHHVVPGGPGNFLPGDAVLALVNPLGPGDGRPDSLVYLSVDPIYGLRPLPADPRLRPELGVDEAGWRAMSYIADAVNDSALQELVTRAITQVETARRELAAGNLDAAGEKRLRARITAVEEELRNRFAQKLSRGK